ncbi:MAG TPA: hypothetical protein PLP88_00040 [Bacteroidales bacterium]|nr:hypothetical protein [Bacteroidales bacterium]
MKLFLKILLIIVWTALVAGAIVLMSFANKSHDLERCQGLEVKIDYPGDGRLTTPDIVKSQLVKEFGKFENKLISDISVEKINRFLGQNQYLSKCDVHLTVEGLLVANVTQNDPILRVMTDGGKSYYIDSEGNIMLANPVFPVRVMVAGGFINMGNNPQGKNISSFSKSTKNISQGLINLLNCHKVSQAITHDSIMMALTEQLFAEADGNIKLLTKTGHHIVNLGNADNLAEKFLKLETFYRSVMPKVGWDRYKSINLAYKNQVICTK